MMTEFLGGVVAHKAYSRPTSACWWGSAGLVFFCWTSKKAKAKVMKASKVKTAWTEGSW